jgi:endonuclease/exonuclease/phosphatase family metal-dependent hydrolase
MWRKLFLPAVSAVVLAACGTAERTTPADVLVIGTFNMEWLGDGVDDRKPRSTEDYKRIARAVEAMHADVIGVQEVENIAALQRVLSYLPGYAAVVGTGGREQNVGFLYRTDIDVRVIGEYAPLAVVAGRNRPGYVITCRKGTFDAVVMSVHLKSTSRYDSTEALRNASFEQRRQQAAIVRRWIDSVRSAADPDVIVVGDFNDFPNRKKNATLTALLENDSLTFATRGLASCRYEGMEGIDHVVVSASIAPRIVSTMTRTENLRAWMSDAEVKNVSDHCPVVVGIRHTP